MRWLTIAIRLSARCEISVVVTKLMEYDSKPITKSTTLCRLDASLFWCLPCPLRSKTLGDRSLFKTAKHQFGLHCFGQATKISVYRWLILSFIAYLLTHWIELWPWPPKLYWKATPRLTLKKLIPPVPWTQLLKQLEQDADIAAHFGFDVVLKPRISSA